MRRKTKRLWIGLAVGLVLAFILGVVAMVLLATTSVHVSVDRPQTVPVFPAKRIRSVRVPDLVGLTGCNAKRLAVAAGLDVHIVPARGCDAIVVRQTPAPGSIVPRHTPAGTVTLRLRD